MDDRKRHRGLRCSRRRMLQVMVLGALPLAGRRAAAAEVPEKIMGSILERTIPASGERVPALGLGTWQTFDVGSGAEERAPLREVLRLFVEMGGTVIDSSPMYGRSEEVVGDLSDALGVQRTLFLATKVWTHGRESGVGQMERSMGRLRSKQIDLMQIHNLVDWRTHLPTLRDWKAAGRIRYVGITHYTTGAYDALARLMRTQRLDFVQLNYSLATRDAERRLLPLAAERGLGTLINRPFEGGALFHRVRGRAPPSWAAEFDCDSWAQFFLKYVLSHPAVTCAIPATSDPKHLVDNMQAAYGRLPDAATRRKMVSVIESL
ncbi:MAG: aldo/keto reductase [Gammaproteobacteria bacterium]|nr:aldo/keto reductase [Gammaproteobacteria bacterium]NIR83643.1 aldo/keto reductase [Gammaproteobacteria bacterium]NIR91616.1 aldo/keto reductase [Gammaproteobacteria bacterium]NIU04805.1 aldo/keto reductase [Gammaproteobacteria bacterium]NIV53155.1 aldo/keto reductase [Gammaproteobacteria bacterium]